MAKDGERRHWIKINRAPVLTLWAAVVAEQLGFERDEALTLGRAVAGLNAYSKGKSIGLFSPTSEELKKKRKELREKEGMSVDLMQRAVPVTRTDKGLRALSKDKPIDPDSVRRYLDGKFGDALNDSYEAMTHLARNMDEDELSKRAYELYEEFRPEVPAGEKGWGAKGRLYLDTIRAMAQ
ncbi:MAG: hypothetical protein R3316_08325 [Rhodovibrionaceae bacterium]|nr:hypothetical protein [Rhodovibrionaceae bacterium]